MVKHKDICWRDVAISPRDNQHNPEVKCKFCEKTWFSNSKSRVYEHMKNCTSLPNDRKAIYGIDEESPEIELPRRRRPRTGTWFDEISADQHRELDETLAEFFYGSGIALNIVS